MISDEDLSIISESRDFYMGAPIGDMAKELLALRKARLDGVEVAAGVYTILGIAGYSSSATGCAQQKLMLRAGKVIYKAKEDNIDFDWYAGWMG